MPLKPLASSLFLFFAVVPHLSAQVADGFPAPSEVGSVSEGFPSSDDGAPVSDGFPVAGENTPVSDGFPTSGGFPPPVVTPTGSGFPTPDKLKNETGDAITSELGIMILAGKSNFLNGSYITSTNKKYFVILQEDGNLVVNRGSGPFDNKGEVWSSRTAGQPGKHYASIDGGDLCLHHGVPGIGAASYWCAISANSPANELWLSDAGFLSLYNVNSSFTTQAWHSAEDPWGCASGDSLDFQKDMYFAASIISQNSTNHSAWITVYDLAKTQHLDYGLVCAVRQRRWTSGTYSWGSFYYVRAEVKNERGDTICDTTVQVNPQVLVTGIGKQDYLRNRVNLRYDDNTGACWWDHTN
jgi:hypothetical protein